VTAWCAALALLQLRDSLTSGKVPGSLDVLAPGIAGALERSQLALQQLGFVMSSCSTALITASCGSTLDSPAQPA
jgi:hypothetical protein